MDGFYVAKIQKLSDRKPDDFKEPNEETAEGSTVESPVVTITPTMVKVQTSDDTKSPTKKWIMKGKKRGKGFDEDRPKKMKKAKSDHLSIPPKRTVLQTKVATIKKASAKTSKPRRRKLEESA